MARMAEYKRDQQEVELAKLQLEMMKMQPNKVPDNLPSWAIKRW